MIDPRRARRRYLLLLALRWFPTGLLIPVFTLVGLDRGLTVAQVGLTAAVQGVVVAVLELPTGGLADTWGRRPVLMLAGLVGTASLAVFVVADSVALFALAWFLQGVYRALDSGPLEAWYVDTALAADPDARLDRALGAGTTVLSTAIAAGALAAGGLVALTGEVDAPLPVALGIQALGIAAPLLLREPRRAAGTVWRSVTGVPRAVRDGIGTVGRSRPLLALTGIGLLWGIGTPTFESLFPVRLAEVAGGTATAAALLGPAVAVTWLVSAGGASIAPRIAGRTGTVAAAVAFRIVQGAAIVAMGLLAGPAGALAGYLLCYLAHGAGNPLHMALLHAQVDGPQRATVLSVSSLAFQLGGSVGLVTLSALADAVSTPVAIVTGGAVLALAAPLYLLARSRRPVETEVGIGVVLRPAVDEHGEPLGEPPAP